MFGLIKFDAQTKTAELMQEHVERLWDAWCRHWVALNDSLVSLRTAHCIVGLDCQNFLKHVAGTECLDSPNLHLTETLTTELCLTTEWLLRDDGPIERACILSSTM